MGWDGLRVALARPALVAARGSGILILVAIQHFDAGPISKGLLAGSLFAGLLVALPVVLYQAWAFTACAMNESLRRSAARLVPLSYLLFLFGVAVAVFAVVPVAIKFLISYGSEAVVARLRVGAYVDFVAMIALAFGLVFQMPLVLLFLERAGMVTREGLAAKRRYIYFLGFVAADSGGRRAVSQGRGEFTPDGRTPGQTRQARWGGLGSLMVI